MPQESMHESQHEKFLQEDQVRLSCTPKWYNSSSCSQGLGCYGVGIYSGVFYCKGVIYAERCC